MTNPPRSYNCKNEELTAICRNSLVSLKRDQADFTAYSPKLTEEYTAAYEAKVIKAEELVVPRSETIELKRITARIFSTMDNLLDYTNQLSGYIRMGNDSINLSVADFGISTLKKGINARDPERVVSKLKDVNSNITKYGEVLAEQGLTPELRAKFTDASASIIADRKSQYEILTNRKALVQSNIGLFNDLYDQLLDICNTGKILYKRTDPVKLQEYTFSEIKKKVRRIAQSGDGPDEPQEGTPQN